jgi:hypothetical protein
MPELVALVLSTVDHVSLAACPFVCTTWKRASLPLLLEPDLGPEEGLQLAGGSLALLQWRGPTAAPGTRGPVRMQPREAISRCSSGRAPTAAPGTRQRVSSQLMKAISTWAQANGCPSPDHS